MDIFKEMKKEHDEFRKMAEKIVDTTTRATKIRTEDFGKLKLEITAHHEAEEIVLVPVLKEKKATKEMGLEIVEEHDVLSRLLDELEELDVTDEKWIVKFKVLKEIMEKHLVEEENEISEEAHKEFDQKRLDELGDKFTQEDEKQEEMLKKQRQNPDRNTEEDEEQKSIKENKNRNNNKDMKNQEDTKKNLKLNDEKGNSQDTEVMNKMLDLSDKKDKMKKK